MNFSRRPPLLLLLVFLLGATGCGRNISPEEKTTRAELRRALQQRHFAEAIPLAERVLQWAPNDNGAWARLAQAQSGKRDLAGLEQTLSAWRKTVKRTSPKYDEYQGDLAFARGRPAQALVAWRKAVAGRERRARVFLKIARTEQAAGQWQEAALAWTRALTTHETAAALRNRAICYRHLHSWEAALADLERAAAIAPQDVLVREEKDRLDRLGKFLDEVRELDKQVAALPNDAGLIGDRALLFLRAGDPPLALEDATRAAQLSPSAIRPKLLHNLAQQSLPRPGAPANETPGLRNLTPQFLQTIRRLDAELAAEPESAELLTNRAWQLNEIGQPRFALADAEAALRSDPKSAGAAVEASYALAKLQRAAEAYESIKRATVLDPNFSTAWQYRGELETARGDYQSAIDSLTRALAINRTPETLALRAECYRHLGLLAKAEDDRKAREELSTPR